MKRKLITATAVIKILVLCQIFVKRKAKLIKPTLAVTLLDINSNVTLAHVKHLKIVLEMIKSHSTLLNIKMIRYYQKNLRNSKSTIEHQNYREIIRICRFYNPNSQRCFLCLNKKYKIATYKRNNLLNKRIEVISTCRHRSKYKIANCETMD